MLKFVSLSFVLVICAASYKGYEGNSPHYKVSTTNLEDENGCRSVEVRLDHGDKELWDVNTIQSAGSTIAKITPRRCDTGGIKTVPGGDFGGEPDSTKVITSRNNEKCSSPSLTCPSQAALISLGYELTPSISFFKIHKYGPKWEDAKKKCEEEQAHLVFVKSVAHVLALIDLINRKGSRGAYWLGFSDRDKEGHYVTIFNQTLEAAGYNTWMVGEPNGGVAQNCGLFHYNAQGQYGLGDHDCNSGAWFICEVEDV